MGWAADDATPWVGRVSAVAGPAQYHAPAGEWSGAMVNEPIAAGAGLRTAPGAEAELRGPSIQVALAPSSEMRVARFDDDALQIAVLEGRLGVHLDGAGPTTVEIDLPHGGVWLEAPGDYDIAAGDAQAPAAIRVFAGKAQLGGGLDDSHIVAADPDSFSDWWRSQNDDSDKRARRELPGIAGAAALDAAGRWETDSQLGKVWYPSGVAADWTPYRDGVWRFLPPWGWTWIGAEPWAFAASHYGRWARVDDRWAWVPGPQIAATDYSPAGVAFIGTAGIGLSRPGDAGAAIAWFPLAPGEAIGDGNDADYKNRAFATAVPRTIFAGGFAVAAAVVDDIPRQRLADAPVVLDAIGIAPAGAAAPKKPASVVLAAVAGPKPARPAASRQSFLAHLHEMLARAARKRLRVAAEIVPRPRPLPSTSALRSTHNRQHLAAARGGA